MIGNPTTGVFKEIRYVIPDNLNRFSNDFHDDRIKIPSNLTSSAGGTLELELDKVTPDSPAKLIKKGVLLCTYARQTSRLTLSIKDIEQISLVEDHGLEWYTIFAMDYNQEMGILTLSTLEGTKVQIKTSSLELVVIPTNRQGKWQIEKVFLGRRLMFWYKDDLIVKE